MAQRLVVSAEVSHALAAGQPIVVLETSVTAQGMPWPENLDTAKAVEAAVRESGAVPAAVAVLDGTIRAGLSDAELFRVARSAAEQESTGGPKVTGNVMAGEGDESHKPARGSFSKATRRDLAAFIALGMSAGTTVSATLWVARRLGLKPLVVATGGLGGVHHGATSSFDVSTDLHELARADGTLVVCSGIKSILDVGASLQALETGGVLVLGYCTSELPGFLTRSSGLVLEHRVDTCGEAAMVVRAHRAIGLPGAIVLAQPVPVDQALDQGAFGAALEKALVDAERLGISGKLVTPFLLESIRRATGGRSLVANRALLIANARLAADVAVVLASAHGECD